MKFRLNYLFMLFVAMLLSCNKSSGALDLAFSPTSATLEAGLDVGLVLKYRYGDSEWKEYDFSSKALDLTLASSKESVATVSSDGVVHTLKSGYTNITATCGESSAKFTLMVSGTSYDINIDFSKKLTGDMVYSNRNTLPDNTAMQSFDILNNGDIMLAGSRNDDKLYFKLISPGKDSNNIMSVAGAGHGTNISVEEDGTGSYVWFTSHGDWIITRMKFAGGMSYTVNDCTDNYYIGDAYYPCVCTDVEHDLIAITVSSKVRIYKLSEARKAPVRKVSLNSGKIQINAHDLTSIQSVGDFTINQSVPIQGIDRDGDTRPWQGFCVYKDRLYWFSGDGTNPDCAISVITFDGVVEKSCKELSLDDEPDDYIKLGVSETGYLEPEGIKIRHGKVYLGFIWNLKNKSPWTWRSTIINYN